MLKTNCEDMVEDVINTRIIRSRSIAPLLSATFRVTIAVTGKCIRETNNNSRLPPYLPNRQRRSEHAVRGLSRRGADDYDTTPPPTHRESTAARETINPDIQADENDIMTWPSF